MAFKYFNLFSFDLGDRQPATFAEAKRDAIWAWINNEGAELIGEFEQNPLIIRVSQLGRKLTNESPISEHLAVAWILLTKFAAWETELPDRVRDTEGVADAEFLSYNGALDELKNRFFEDLFVAFFECLKASNVVDWRRFVKATEAVGTLMASGEERLEPVSASLVEGEPAIVAVAVRKVLEELLEIPKDLSLVNAQVTLSEEEIISRKQILVGFDRFVNNQFFLDSQRIVAADSSVDRENPFPYLTRRVLTMLLPKGNKNPSLADILAEGVKLSQKDSGDNSMSSSSGQ